MSTPIFDRPTLRSVVGLLLLGGIVLLALVPNSGALSASSGCTYGSCTSTAPSTPVTWYILLAVLIIVAAALAVLLLMRRRRPPTAPTSVEPWSGPAAEAAPAAAAAAPPTMPTDAGPAADYIETDSDVAQPHPDVPGAVGGGAAGGAAESGGDIDSLMQELDKISGEILQRGKPKKPDADGGSEPTEGGEATDQ